MKSFRKEDYKLITRQLSVKPFVFSRPSVSSISLRFIILLSLQVICLILTKSYEALFVVTVSFAGSLAAASLDYLINKSQPYKIMNVIIQGLLIGLLLPENYPIVSVFFITFITLFISRCFVFKNTNSWINISAFAVVVAWFIGQKFFPSFTITSDIVGLKNSSVYLIQNGDFPIYSFDNAITSFLNTHILNHFHTTIPEGFISILCDNHSAIPAFRFNLLTIISSIVIFSDNAFSSVVPTVFIIVYVVLVRIFSTFLFGGMLNQGDVFLSLFTSGILFGAVFLIQRFGSLPVSLLGKIIHGSLLGVTAFVVIGCGTSPIGMVYTIVIGDIFCMMIRFFEERHNTRSIAKNYSGRVAVKGEN